MNNFLYGDIHFKELYYLISCFPLLNLILASLEAFCVQDHDTDNEIQIKLWKIIFLQISMNVKMESMIAFLVWLPV